MLLGECSLSDTGIENSNAKDSLKRNGKIESHSKHSFTRRIQFMPLGLWARRQFDSFIKTSRGFNRTMEVTGSFGWAFEVVWGFNEMIFLFSRGNTREVACCCCLTSNIILDGTSLSSLLASLQTKQSQGK